MAKPELLIIAGPTASGKTAVAVELALRLDAEVVSADSMQVYRDMDILTAMPTPEEMRGVPHHMLGVFPPDQKCSAAARLHPNDVRRVVRALEIYRITGRTQSEQAALDAQRGDGPFSERVYALDWPREALYARIDRRVDEMLQSGLVDEVRRLMKNEAAFSTAAQAIGYKEIAAALRGECALAEAVETLKRATRNYAKRQLTWFRRDARVRWVAAQGLSAAEIAEKIITDIEVRL